LGIEEDALGGFSSKQKKNESAQEETTDTESRQQPSTSGIALRPREKVKTISWKQGVSRMKKGIHNGKLKGFWVGEEHGTTKGKKLFIDMLSARLLPRLCVCCFFLGGFVFLLLRAKSP
jgi:hypothetical protein